jgi:hypothetical protein
MNVVMSPATKPLHVISQYQSEVASSQFVLRYFVRRWNPSCLSWQRLISGPGNFSFRFLIRALRLDLSPTPRYTQLPNEIWIYTCPSVKTWQPPLSLLLWLCSNLFSYLFLNGNLLAWALYAAPCCDLRDVTFLVVVVIVVVVEVVVEVTASAAAAVAVVVEVTAQQ